MRNLASNKKGISLIEILVAVSILAIVLVSLLALISLSLSATSLISQRTRASSLAQEVLEATRNFRDQTSWNTDGLGTLAIGGLYHPEKTLSDPPEWDLVLGSETVDIFTRHVVIDAAYRDLAGNLADLGAADPDARKATVAIWWQERGRTQKLEIASYFTNWEY